MSISLCVCCGYECLPKGRHNANNNDEIEKMYASNECNVRPEPRIIRWAQKKTQQKTIVCLVRYIESFFYLLSRYFVCWRWEHQTDEIKREKNLFTLTGWWSSRVAPRAMIKLIRLLAWRTHDFYRIDGIDGREIKKNCSANLMGTAHNKKTNDRGKKIVFFLLKSLRPFYFSVNSKSKWIRKKCTQINKRRGERKELKWFEMSGRNWDHRRGEHNKQIR